MAFIPFALERWQSSWEKQVRFNLAESGVHAFSIAEFLQLTDTAASELLSIHLGYGQSDGTPDLRSAIAARYPGASTDQVTVTVGSAEANFVLCWALIEPGDHVVVVAPMYMQIPGLARNFGASVTEVRLDPSADWRLDLAEVEKAVRPGTKLVVVTNPNNPTGRTLTLAERETVSACADAAGAWLLADEVYRGAERADVVTPSFWGTAERVLIVNGLSKAYGLPGLRIGWIVSPAAFKHDILLRHDYTVIGPPPPSDRLAALALHHEDAVFQRTRAIIRHNYPILADWLGAFGDRFTWHAPDSGAIALARYDGGPDSITLVERARETCDVLLAPGAHFGIERAIRFGFGNEQSELQAALATLRPAIEALLD